MTIQRSTNFFERQEQARTNCRKLVVLFTLAVLGIIIAIYFAFRLVCYINLLTNVIDVSHSPSRLGKYGHFLWWDPSLFAIVFIAVTFFIVIACMIKMNQLQKGGGAIAEMLGGRLVAGRPDDPSERQLLNVVEEMAIASGIPVPQVYILDKENGINAFAAGLTINDAAVAVTRGSLNRLTRDELQGVIAHEFSHILNGDMRLNIQLIGIVYGILVIGIIGGEIIEARRISSKSAVLFFAGVLLAAIGYIGTFMGQLIQSAVSRQKEFLADASAVKFTRNPTGLANALKKIGGYIYGSRINSPTAKQASHLFFGESHSDFFFPDFLATHPPLIERIRLLDPTFDGTLPEIEDNIPPPKTVSADTALSGVAQVAAASPAPASQAKAADVIGQVGKPTADNLDHGSAILSSIPDQIRQTLNTPHGAAAVIYALLLGNDCRERELQLNAIHRSLVGNGNVDETLRLCDFVSGLKENQRLPLIELAMPQLRSLTAMEKRNFLEIINSLISADGKITLFEFSVNHILNQCLIKENEDIFSKTTFFEISQVGYHVLIILRALANAGNIGDAHSALLAFNSGISRIPELAAKNPDFTYEDNINFAPITTALQQLNLSSFKIKQTVVDACSHCAFADKTITVAEAELLRVISLAMHCPLPPFVPDKS